MAVQFLLQPHLDQGQFVVTAFEIKWLIRHQLIGDAQQHQVAIRRV